MGGGVLIERKIIEMMGKIEVPKETSQKAEELLARELLGLEKKMEPHSERVEKRTSVVMKNRRSSMNKIVGASTAVAMLAIAVIGVSLGVKKDRMNIATPKVTANVTATPQDEVLQSLKRGNVYRLRQGKNLIDLDLDGVKEEIILENKSSDVTHKPYAIHLGKQTIEGEVDREDGLQLCAAMLTGDKRSVQLMFTKQYGSDDYLTDIYNYENGALVKVGTVAEDVDNIKPEEDGSFAIYQPGGTLGLWKNSIVRIVNNEHKVGEITGKYCIKEEDQVEKEKEFRYSITALMQVAMYGDMDPGSNKIAFFQAGEKGKTIKVIDGRWLYLENSKGQKGYLEISPEDFVIDGKIIEGWKVFEGLPYAG